MKWLIVVLSLAGAPVVADPFAVLDTAHGMYDRLPKAAQADPLVGVCGADRATNAHAFYCTSTNTIYHSPGFASRPQAAYEMAHLLGHAVQVRHGVADVALRAIIRDRDREPELRGMVERQVNCIAGVFLARAGLPNVDIQAAFGQEPWQHAHWGREPVRNGPHLAIGVEAVQEWLTTGYTAADVSVCAVGDFSSTLLVRAQR